MVRADRLALATACLLTKASLGFLGLALLIGWGAPPPRTAAVSGPLAGTTAMTVAMRLPREGPASHLTVVDEAGRELATLTLWASGMRTMVSRSGAIAVCMYLGADGSARAHMATTEGTTVVEATPDGTTRVSYRDDAIEHPPGPESRPSHPPDSATIP